MAKKETLTDDGKLEEVDMEEAKSANKELGLPDLGDDEEGRKDSEPDGEDGTKKASDPKNKKSKASAKQEAKAKKEEDDDDEDDEDDEDEMESKKESKSKKEGKPPWLDKDKDDDDDEEDMDEGKMKELEQKKLEVFTKFLQNL